MRAATVVEQMVTEAELLREMPTGAAERAGVTAAEEVATAGEVAEKAAAVAVEHVKAARPSGLNRACMHECMHPPHPPTPTHTYTHPHLTHHHHDKYNSVPTIDTGVFFIPKR